MGVILESSSSPLLFLHRNFITPLLLCANKSLATLSRTSKLLELLRQLFIVMFFVVFNIVQSLPLPRPFRFEGSSKERSVVTYHESCRSKKQLVKSDVGNGCNDTAIARAINQVLTLVNDVPVSSRKYEVVRGLAEKLIDDNLKEGSESLRMLNCTVLSEAFGRSLLQLEADLLGQGYSGGFGPGFGLRGCGLHRVVRVVKQWGKVKEGGEPSGSNSLLAEKTAAELLWLAQKLEVSGGGEVAVDKWAKASNLGWLALSADPRVQASLLKLSAFLIIKAKDMGKGQHTDGEEIAQQKQTNMKLLLTWMPLLCRASNGTDAPTLSIGERGEIERALEEIIDMLEEEEIQEKVLSVWLHHFTRCPSSDWPNLSGSYIRWCTHCRELLLTC